MGFHYPDGTYQPFLCVQKNVCATCPYRKEKNAIHEFTIEQLENNVRSPDGELTSYSVCHHTEDFKKICCQGFYSKNKDKSRILKQAQEMEQVLFVDVDDILEMYPELKKDPSQTMELTFKNYPNPPSVREYK